MLLREFDATGDALQLTAYALERDARRRARSPRGSGSTRPLLQAAWARADATHQQALLGALTQLGVPYRRNTSKPGEGFDCSGLTTFAWARPASRCTRQSAAQIRAAGAAHVRDRPGRRPRATTPATCRCGSASTGRSSTAPYTGRNVEVKIQGGNKSLRFGDPTG